MPDRPDPPPGAFSPPPGALPPGVVAVQTTRAGGASVGPYASMNLGLHVDDDPGRVRRNRRALVDALPDAPRWLRQVHGTRILDVDAPFGGDDPVEADGATTARPGRPVAVLTADCLPVVLADGARVTVVHAGWRGLAAGIVRAAVAGFGEGRALSAWLGPAIGPDAFEVGDEVREAFVRADPAHEGAFRRGTAPGRHLADLYALARTEARAAARGADVAFSGGDRCTFAEARAFFSHRRDGPRTGRMATLAWLEPPA